MKMRHLQILSTLIVFGLLSAQAHAQAIAARETAYTEAAGTWTTGVFNPLRIALSADTCVETHPLLDAMGAFNVGLQHQQLREKNWVLSYSMGLNIPTLAFRLSQQIPLASPFFPTWTDSGRRIGWTMEPSLGLLWSYGTQDAALWTLRGDLSVGLPLEPSDAYPVDSTFAPLELVLAPSLTGFRARVGAGYDYPILNWLRLRAQGNVYLTGAHPADKPQLSPLFFETYAGLDVGLGDNARLTFGAKWYNWDQHATDVRVDDAGRAKRVPVRSNDFLPTIDFIWHS